MTLLDRIVKHMADRWFPVEPSGLRALFTFDGPVAEKPLAHPSAPVAVAVRCDAIGCLACSPVHHPADVTRVYWWLREGPNADYWYWQSHGYVLATARALLTLQRDVQRGRWGRG